MSETSSPKRPRLDFDDTKDDHFDKYGKNRDQDDQSNFAQSKSRKRPDIDDDDGKDEDGKSKSVTMETARREHTLVMRLTNKEQELQDCMNQIQEMKQAQTQNTAQLRSMLLDPAINLVFQRMAGEMDEHKEKLKQKQNELSAWKFTPDSQTGMRLMAKCRMLLQENGELGKMISSGRTTRLEGEITLHKALVTGIKQNRKELDEFVGELEEDVEGMQGMIFMLQQQLKEAREQIARLQQENEQLRTLRMPPDPEPGGDAQNHYGSSSSNNNTPQHNWPDQSGGNSPVTGTDPDSTASTKLLGSCGLLGSSATVVSVESSVNKSTAPSSSFSATVVPPALSAMSSGFRNAAATSSCEQTSMAKSSGEEVNGGFLAHKVTPDSGMLTEEENTSADTATLTAAGSLSTARVSGPPNTPQQVVGNALQHRTTGSNEDDAAPHTEGESVSCPRETSQHGVEQTTCSGPSDAGSTQNATVSSSGSNSSNSKPSSANPSCPSPESGCVTAQTCENSSDSKPRLNGCNELTEQSSSELLADDGVTEGTVSPGRTSSSSGVGAVPVESSGPHQAVQEEASDRRHSERLQKETTIKSDLLSASTDLAVTTVVPEENMDCQTTTKQPLVNGSSSVPDEGL
ncbi:pre-mRNA-splicing regulator WTAP [Aplysia californica]|uniref:Pre-mRNA-splicing regulator WTAP n=1 Tax=Aplysia californica TaxID=6500 RepID=A0ABM0JYS1_APLCA|nr:pre-mRNA-splicing regulator WTAP [Aplysia californica]